MGQIERLLLNISPGSALPLVRNVFWCIISPLLLSVRRALPGEIQWKHRACHVSRVICTLQDVRIEHTLIRLFVCMVLKYVLIGNAS